MLVSTSIDKKTHHPSPSSKNLKTPNPQPSKIHHDLLLTIVTFWFYHRFIPLLKIRMKPWKNPQQSDQTRINKIQSQPDKNTNFVEPLPHKTPRILEKRNIERTSIIQTRFQQTSKWIGENTEFSQYYFNQKTQIKLKSHKLKKQKDKHVNLTCIFRNQI